MRAKAQGLNLVEVAPNVRPPVCKILDFGKYKYDLKQDAKRKKKNQVTIEVKEVKFRPKVDKHDFEFKIRHCERFLKEGDKVKCTIMFRGRELAHPEIGEDVLRRVLAVFEGKVNVEMPPRMDGRNMFMQIGPKPGAFPKPVKAAVKVEAKGSSQRVTRADRIAAGLKDDEDLPEDEELEDLEDEDLEDEDDEDEDEGDEDEGAEEQRDEA